MKKITTEDLLDKPTYEKQRPAFRSAILEHKKNRRLLLGPNASLHFEDFMTMKYQVQELIRVENLTRAEDITEELEAYNPLIPDGANLKATFMIEFPDEGERRRELARLMGIEDQVCIAVQGCDPIYPIADEDLERETDEKTSAVHFLRFEFPADAIQAAKEGAPWTVRSEHTHYRHEVSPVPDPIRTSLVRDFD
ncbi:MAG: DUF3501 family protein [Pseudohongiellaceae bacterium]